MGGKFHREAIKNLNELAMLRPNFRPRFSRNSKSVKFHSNGKDYEITDVQLKSIARALDESMMYTYRISPDSKQVQFLVQKETFEKLTPEATTIVNTFFNQTYRGHFKSTARPARYLCVFVDGEEFFQGTAGSYSDISNHFGCIQRGCLANLILAVVKTEDGKYEVKYHFVPHDAHKAHSHNDRPAPPAIGEPPNITGNSNRRKRTSGINPTDLQNRDFVQKANFDKKKTRQKRNHNIDR